MSAFDSQPAALPRYRSKTVATWIAIIGGTFGLHRFYLNGPRDRIAWLFPWPTLLGLAGMVRLRNLGQDDHVAWLLIPLLGVMLSIAMLSAIVHGLTPDEKWDARHNPGQRMRTTAWGPVIGVILALLMGGIALMGTLAYGGQKFFEWQLEDARDDRRRPDGQLAVQKMNRLMP